MSDARLGPRHADVQRLRVLLRDRQARAQEQAFVAEGPRVIGAALDRGAALDVAYVAPGARRAFAPLMARLADAAVPVVDLKEGVLERIASTVTPQPVLAVAPMPYERRRALADLRAAGPVLVLVDVSDPGNAGTLIRTAEAAGAAGVVTCGDGVDPYNPKVVRASAGAIFGVPVLGVADPVDALTALRAAGRTTIGSVVAGGATPDALDLRGPVALVVGGEARGLPAGLNACLDATVTIPLASPHVESLNVAMAGTVLCFEAARQRAAADPAPAPGQAVP